MAFLVLMFGMLQLFFSYLVEELFARRVGLDGKLQLCVHCCDAHVHLKNTKIKLQSTGRKTDKSQYIVAGFPGKLLYVFKMVCILL